MLSISDIRNYDKSDMFSKLVNFAQQVEEAVKIGEGVKVNFSIKKINKIVLTGLGGSAIAGDLLRSYLSDEIKVPIIVNRDYFLPKFARIIEQGLSCPQNRYLKPHQRKVLSNRQLSQSCILSFHTHGHPAKSQR